MSGDGYGKRHGQEEAAQPLLSDAVGTHHAGGGGARARGAFVQSWTALYMLGLYTLMATLQCLFWFTFSSAPTLAEEYYDVDAKTIDLILSWGPIVFVPVVPVASWMYMRRSGLQSCIRTGYALCFLGCLLRAIPSVLSAETRRSTAGLSLVHLGQILVAAAGPYAMAGPSRLSAIWFLPEHRTTATGIAYLGGNCGAALGFLMGPFVIDGDASRVANLLYIELGMVAAPSLCAALYCPDHPEVAVSSAVNVHARDAHQPSVLDFFRSVAKCFTVPALILLMVIGGIEAGTNTGWGGVLPQILQDNGFTSKFAGLCGFAATLSSMAGNLLVGLIGDRFFKQRLKALLAFSFYLAALCYAWFSFCVRVPFLGDDPVLPSNETIVLVALTIAGLFQGCCDPLFYELAAEVSYPMEEGTSAGLITLIYNVASLVMFFVAPYVSVSWMNLVLAAVLMLSGGCVLAFVKEDYRRTRVEALHKGAGSLVN